MKKTLFLITFLIINLLSAQNIRTENELCVININGAKVYEQPTFNSKAVSIINSGETIIMEKTIITNEKFKIGDSFSLSGEWIKGKNINGFIFSSDLTNKNAEIITNQYGKKYLNLLGNTIDEKIEKKIFNPNSGQEYSIYTKYTYYENGIEYYGHGDGCVSLDSKYKQLNLNEVYHIIIARYGELTEFKNLPWIPVFKKEDNTTVFYFNFEATDLTIIIYNDNRVEIFNSSCD